jgi:hypothetical protein
MGLKRTTEEVTKYFEDQGCKLLDEYTGCMDLMDYQCKCGEYSSITWNNFTKGKRCGYCVKQGQKKKRSLEEVKKIFRDRGCEFLDSEFKGIHFKHRYRCKCGMESQITFAGFHHQNQYCYKCGIEKNKGPRHHGWKPDREQFRLDKLFKKKCYSTLRKVLVKTGLKKLGRTSEVLGYTPQQLQDHIKSHPNWEKVKDKSWHLDHIFPIMAFLEYGIKDIKLINALDNLQPLIGEENISKADTYNKEEFILWLIKKAEHELGHFNLHGIYKLC